MPQKLGQLIFETYNGRVNNLIDAQLNSYKITKLAGDASTRTYYRAIEAATQNSFILMVLDPTTKGSEEAVTFDSSKIKKMEIPFVNVHRYLEYRGIDVPKIYEYNEQYGILILEDVGDELLQTVVSQSNDLQRTQLYKQAIDAMIQFHKSKPSKFSCYGFSHSFDLELYNWEFNHFIEYQLQQADVYSERIEIPASNLKILSSQFNDISLYLSDLPRVFTHRDFHSRNLLCFADRMVVIDFQDALMAPSVYDLASLLMDAYVDLCDDLIESLIEYYYLENPNGYESIEVFKKSFDWIAIQRMMKAAGRFEFFNKVNGNASYLKDVPKLMERMMKLLGKYKGLKKSYDILMNYHPLLQNR